MTNGNGNDLHKMPFEYEESENERLKAALRKAVNSGTAPQSLKDRIKKMIREK